MFNNLLNNYQWSILLSTSSFMILNFHKIFIPYLDNKKLFFGEELKPLLQITVITAYLQTSKYKVTVM